MIVGNATITGSNITNHTTLGTRRGAVAVGVAYGADIGHTKQVVLDAVSELDMVLEEPAPAIAFVDMAASSLNFSVMCWCRSDDYLGMLDAMRTASYEALNAAGIEIPFDQVVVHIERGDEAAWTAASRRCRPLDRPVGWRPTFQ